MRLYFGGAEIPSHRKVLRELNADSAALSFIGLTRRIKNTTAWALAEKFPDECSLLVDSGAYTLNKNEQGYTVGELKDLAQRYFAFVEANAERVDAVTEFDSLTLGKSWIEEQRVRLIDLVGADKFIPIWHEEWGVDYLQEMAREFPRIGITTLDVEGLNIVPILNRIAANGTRLHGVAMTHVDQMSQVKWDSVSSTSWISPQQYGDTIVWTGRELKRYPKKYKEQARKRYRTLFEREGFDAEKIENDDSTEVLRLSVWSWTQLVKDIEKHTRPGLRVVTNQPEEGDSRFVEVDGEEVDTQTGETRKPVSTPAVIEKRPTMTIPVLGATTRTEKSVNPETGEETEVEVTDYKIRSESERRCVDCYLASKCPAFDPGATCAFNIPIQIKTRDQFADLQDTVITMQAQRVMFMRFAEEQEGGYADPNLSAEMDRLQKMLKIKHEMEQDGFSLKIEGKATGNQTGAQGILARLFGNDASEAARALPEPIHADAAVEIIDAEWTEK